MGKFYLGLFAVAVIAPQSTQRAVEPTKFAPGAFFNSKCAMCHGENGALYRSDLARGMTEAKLEERLVTMTDGPAQSPLANKDLAVLKTWFRAFLKKEPYVAWTAKDGSKLSFETSSGATLTATANGRSLTLTQTRGVWSLTLPSGVTASSVVLTAKKGEVKTELKLSAASTSHTAVIK